jgi:Helicase conserved C-terminal domain/SNF2-related domain
MDIQAGDRLQARGLIWDVIAADHHAECDRYGLRCAEGDLAGLEWDIHVPPERVTPAAATFDLQNPAPLTSWLLRVRAHKLQEMHAGTGFLARDPGRIRIEPYQLVPLMRALEQTRVRLLLADGVGLGKTVQACLIAVELIARRRAHRILIVSPPGPLLSQWEKETRLRFGLKFTTQTCAADLWDLRRCQELGTNPFEGAPLCLISIDFAKQDHVLDELSRIAWDLVILDEAHHCVAPAAGEITERRRLAETLATRSDGLLLLTATPHDGHDAHFASLIALLDPSLTDGAGGLVGREYRNHVIRRLKSHVRDPVTGVPLFRPRKVSPVAVDVRGPDHEPVRAFHRALAAFVMPRLRSGKAMGDGLAFVSLLKRSVSTIAACVETLRVVTDRLSHAAPTSRAEQMERARALRAWRRRAARDGGLSAIDEAARQALEAEAMADALRGDPDTEARDLIRLGQAIDDPKIAALELEIRLIRMAHPDANILIYTEYADSLTAAATTLRAAGLDVLTIAGLDPDETREAAAARFSVHDGLILISTDSLSEGLNLQARCHHLIHLDLPYNPNRLEQRNGRIDRYGQTHAPDIRYLYIPGTFEERLLLHLITKYEKARAALDVMPDTLGAEAVMDVDQPLMAGVSDVADDLFRDDRPAIRSLDRAMNESDPDTIAAITKEIDRAFLSFDLMAVAHGWRGASGFNAETEPARRAAAMRGDSDDLAMFVASVIAIETGEMTEDSEIIRAPRVWLEGLEGLPGIDSKAGLVRITRDPTSLPDSDRAFLGRAHPLVARAIRHAARLPASTAMAEGPVPGLLQVFEAEIKAGGRPYSRRLVTIWTARDGKPEVCDDWLVPPRQRPDHAGSVDAALVSWAAGAMDQGRALAELIANDHARAVRDAHLAAQKGEERRRGEWLRTRADRLCGPCLSTTGDLFGAPPPGPVWRHTIDPAARLASFARDPEVAEPRRREANDTLERWKGAARAAPLDPMILRAVGLVIVDAAHVR